MIDGALSDLLAFVATSEGWASVLRRSSAVRDLKAAVASGTLDSEEVRRSVAELLRDFRPGVRFPHEPALAALAVAMESDSSDFAEEFLCSLAQLDIRELRMAAGVARACVQRRARDRISTKNRARVFILSFVDDYTEPHMGPSTALTEFDVTDVKVSPTAFVRAGASA